MYFNFLIFIFDVSILHVQVYTQYGSIGSLVIYYATFYFDFGTFQLFVVQGGMPGRRRTNSE